MIILVTIIAASTQAQVFYQDMQENPIFTYGIRLQATTAWTIEDIEDDNTPQKSSEFGELDIFIHQYTYEDSTVLTYWDFVPQKNRSEPFTLLEGSLISSNMDKDSTLTEVIPFVSNKNRQTYGGVITSVHGDNIDTYIRLWDFADGSILIFTNVKYLEEYGEEDAGLFKSARQLAEKY